MEYNMKIRPPAIPLITIDPYFSVWSDNDVLTESDTIHWTGSPVRIKGEAAVDGVRYGIIGKTGLPAMDQTGFDMDAFSVYYTFEKAGVKLSLTFTSPVKPDEPYLMSRPVSYLYIEKSDTDGRDHDVEVKVSVSEEICLDKVGQKPVYTRVSDIDGIPTAKMGAAKQDILSRAGDDLRIDWGYFYLSARNSYPGVETEDGVTYAFVRSNVREGFLISFAYDDVYSIKYFGRDLEAYWKKDGETISDVIGRAHKEYFRIRKKCSEFNNKLVRHAVRAGGWKYAELLQLSLRQSVAAHKLVTDENGDMLFISKECFSDGCAATTDVSYPSIPLYLIYNPALVQAMLRPIYAVASSPEWKYEFAPHDAGFYPILSGQVYGKGNIKKQMPVEECGNMIIMEAAAAIALDDPSFAASHIELLEKWSEYLKEHGADPEDQLCTDDFAGHLAHNCNLSLKAINALGGMSIIERMIGNSEKADGYLSAAKAMAESWVERAVKPGGGTRLVFGKERGYSLKYNLVWDKLFGTGLFPSEVYKNEFSSYAAHMKKYGVPLDSRADYTKSDWYAWAGCLTNDREAFEGFIGPLWNAYNETPSRVPMTDWYMTDTAEVKGFRNRSVVGGHFMRLAEIKKVLKKK